MVLALERSSVEAVMQKIFQDPRRPGFTYHALDDRKSEFTISGSPCLREKANRDLTSFFTYSDNWNMVLLLIFFFFHFIYFCILLEYFLICNIAGISQSKLHFLQFN